MVCNICDECYSVLYVRLITFTRCFIAHAYSKDVWQNSYKTTHVSVILHATSLHAIHNIIAIYVLFITLILIYHTFLATFRPCYNNCSVVLDNSIKHILSLIHAHHEFILNFLTRLIIFISCV